MPAPQDQRSGAPAGPGEPEAAVARAPEPPARAEPAVIPRWVQLALLPLAVLGLYAVARAAGPVVLVFAIAAIVALLLNPFVTVLRRAGLPRGPAVAGTMVVVALVLAGLGLLVANPVANQVSAFSESVPSIVEDANHTLDDFQAWLDRNGIDVQVKRPGQTALASLGERVSAGSGELVAVTRDALVRVVEGSFALVLVIVLSIYMLLYGERIGASVRKVVPQGDGSAEDDFPTRIQGAVFGYVRGQLLFSLIMGTSAGLMLWVLGSLGIFPEGRTYALFFGAFYGFAELIPYVGPVIGGLPPVLVALFSSEPLDAVWLIIAFTALQQLEGHVVAPQVFGHSLRINPLLVIFALLLGGRLFGFVGAFVALPIAAMLRETVVYLRRHTVLEPWGTPRASQLVGLGLLGSPRAPGAAAAAGGRRCPECGATPAPGAAYCHACGTELGAGDEAAAAGAPH
jgi:predicted PurR-regulated permease PerM